MYDEMIINDELQLIETNSTITTSYQISESELAKQKQEIEAFQAEIQSNRIGFCGNGGLFGIRGDEEQPLPPPLPQNTSTELAGSELPSTESNPHNEDNNNNQTKGGFIANIINHNNNNPTKPCQIVSGWACHKFGRYPHPTSCQKVSYNENCSF